MRVMSLSTLRMLSGFNWATIRACGGADQAGTVVDAQTMCGGLTCSERMSAKLLTLSADVDAGQRHRSAFPDRIPT